MQRHAAALGLLSVLSAGEALAQSVVVPNASATVRGNGGVNVLGPVRTYMLGVAPAQLAAIPPGSVINGVSFRGSLFQGGLNSWPPADALYTNCDVTVGYGLPIASWTGTFLSNFSNTPFPPVMVRSGPMVIEAGTYVNQMLPAPQPNGWGDFFYDFQKTFIYIGGDLAILVTHPGSNQASSPLVDLVSNVPTAAVFYYSTTYQALSGNLQTYVSIARIHYGYGSGCPGTGGMVPNLVQTNNVAGGGAMSFHVGNSPPNSVALYVIGASQANVALPPGCTLLATPTILVPVVLNANGRNAFKAAFPPGLSLTAYAQAFVIDSGAPSGFSASNGVTLAVTP